VNRAVRYFWDQLRQSFSIVMYFGKRENKVFKKVLFFLLFGFRPFQGRLTDTILGGNDMN
jgi:hypothetical protein